ncbi:MAG TPA: maltodextrin glucosidase [Ktedonobacteraceae bacterium]|nr:maltodextrin glucosidase [Ktedonobacteraceae bacterium]
MPNEIWTKSVHHDGSPYYVVGKTFQIGSTITLRLRADREAPIESVFLRTIPNGEQRMQEMHLAPVEGVSRWWEIDLQLYMPRTNYRFYIQSSGGGYWLSAGGMTRHAPSDATDFRVLAGYHAPDWVHDSVFYQIFPDRFYDGDPSNNVRTGEYDCHGQPVVARAWDDLPRPHSESGGSEFFGGDLQGITEKLDYLQDLGVSALYLTPIFTAPSNHKYDVADYKQVDPHFGGEKALVALREELDRRGMRLMLDIVPNHTGSNNTWFLSAQSDATSETADFYTFHQHPETYEAWMGLSSLPKLNYRSDRLREYMYAAPDSVMRYWMQSPFSIDGWRIDVANMMGRQNEVQLGHKVGRGMRRAVKAEKPDAYLIGEHFYDGTAHLQGDELDATMNYQGFMFPVLQWLTDFDVDQIWRRNWPDRRLLSTEAMAAQWQTFLAMVPWQVAIQQFNLLGSHDTPRILTHVGEDSARARLAAALLFTYPGVPCVYYGDEIGMVGAADPDNRRCMIWDEAAWDMELRVFFKQLMNLRRNSPALSRGGFQLLHAEGDTVAFMREAPRERLLIVARRACDGLQSLPVRNAGLPDGTHLCEELTGTEEVVSDGMLSLANLAEVGAQIWRVL